MTAPWLDPSSLLSPVTPPLSNHTVTPLPGNQSCSRDDQVFKYGAYTATYLLVFPVALLSNSGALFVFLRLTPRRSASSVLMTNLALSDAGFSLTLPLRLAYYFRGGRWDLPDWLCRLCVYSFYLNLYTSVLFLTGLSVLRWLAVLQPLRHRSLATPRRASLASLGVWLFVGVASGPFLMQGVTVRAGLSRCFEPSGLPSWKRIYALNYVAVAFGFLLPFATILCCYGSIIRRLTTTAAAVATEEGWRGSKRGNQGRRRQRSVHLVAMVIGTFLLCFLPYHVARSLHLHAMVGGWGCVTTVTLQRVLVVTLCLAAGNSVVNPFLYYCAGRAFRTTVRNASLTHTRSLSSLTHTHRRRLTHTHTHTPTLPLLPLTHTHTTPTHTHHPNTHTHTTLTHTHTPP